jgi:hypothetical protein
MERIPMPFTSQKFIDNRTGEIVTQVPISQIGNFDEYNGPLKAGDVKQGCNMETIIEQIGMFDFLPSEVARTVNISPDVVLVELSTPPKDRQGAVEVVEPGKNVKLADKFEAMAELMQVQIDAKLSNDRQTNTPRRMAQSMSARVDGERMQRVQAALLGLAEHHRAGTMPPELAAINLRSKKAINDLLGAILSPVQNGCHTYYHDTGEPRDESIEAHLLWQFSKPKSPEQEKADRIAELVRGIQFSKIPGYFPTPNDVIDIMLDYAQIEPHHTILEPSAGSGAIVDRLPDDNLVVVYEVNHSLCEILQAKGFDARPIDFLTEIEGAFSFDRVLMNPPFENQQDIEHVLAAFERLQSGGRLVSVMSPSPFFSNNKRAEAFRAFCDEAGAEVIDLPEGSFKSSGTGVATKLVIIDKG